MKTYGGLKRSTGQALVEFALVLPVLLLVVVAIIEFSILMSSYLIVQGTAREAVRQISVGVTDSAVFDSVRQNVVGIDRNQLTFSATPSTATRRRGDPVTVTVTYQHRVLTPLLTAVLGPTLQWQVIAVMRLE